MIRVPGLPSASNASGFSGVAPLIYAENQVEPHPIAGSTGSASFSFAFRAFSILHEHDKANMISVISILHFYATDSEPGIAPNCTNFTDLGVSTLDVPELMLLLLLCS